MSALTTDEMRRLTLVRYLYNLGLNQSREMQPRSELALLPFHDAAEMFLMLAAEHHSAGAADKTTFMQYWDLLKNKSVELTQKDGMRRLNVARISLKHHGLLSAGAEIEGLRAIVTNFFVENTLKVFGIEFHQISLVTLVSDPIIAQYLADAEKEFVSRAYEKALLNVKCAFVLALRKHEESGSAVYRRGRSLRNFSPFMGHSLSTSLDGKTREVIRELIDGIRDMASVVDEAVTIIGYGIDFHNYLEFTASTPIVHVSANGQIIPGPPWRPPIHDREVVQRCINFVVDSAIRLKV